MRTAPRLILFCVLMSLFFASAPAVSAATDSPPPGQIAYVKDSGASGDSVWLINADGTDPRLLADDVGSVGQLAWSPDCAMLAILGGGRTDGGWPPTSAIWLVNADGSGLRQLEVKMPTKPRGLSSGWLNGCAWSPDGTEIALTVQYPDGYPSNEKYFSESAALVIADIGTGQARFVAGNTTDQLWGGVWWPTTGAAIVLEWTSDGPGGLDAVDPTTGDLTGVWHPDDTWSRGEWKNWTLSPGSYDFAADGSEMLAVWVGMDWETWEEGPSFLVASDPRGGDARELLRSGDNDDFRNPSCSPDRKWIALERSEWDAKTGPWSKRTIAVMPADGKSAPVHLADGMLPAWRPTAPFRPMPHGYAFRNEGYHDAEAARTAWNHLFGSSLWDRLADHPAKSFAEKLFASGVCYGLATTSLAAYAGAVDPSSFGAGATALNELGDYGITREPDEDIKIKLPSSLKSSIEEYFTAQFAKVLSDARRANAFYQKADSDEPTSMGQFVERLQKALVSGPVCLTIFGNLASGRPVGHAVVAYGIRSYPDGSSGIIFVYDNNWPEASQGVAFDLTGGGSWSYPVLLRETTCISFVPLETVQRVVDAPVGSTKAEEEMVSASSEGSILFLTETGDLTGKIDGRYFDDNPLVRLDPLLDGGLGPHYFDRYAVQGNVDRAFRLESDGTRSTWASGRGPKGSYYVQVDGALDVAAAYEGDAVGFSGASASEIRLTVENGALLGEAVFDSTGGEGQGALRLQGSSAIEVQSSKAPVSEILLADNTQLVVVDDVPKAFVLRVDLTSFNSEAGTLTLALDRDGDGTLEVSVTAAARLAGEEPAAGPIIPVPAAESEQDGSWFDLWMIPVVLAVLALICVGLFLLLRRLR